MGSSKQECCNLLSCLSLFFAKFWLQVECARTCLGNMAESDDRYFLAISAGVNPTLLHASKDGDGFFYHASFAVDRNAVLASCRVHEGVL